METITLSLPGGQILGKDEAIVRVDKFTSSLSTFYIKSEFCLTNKRFVAHYPNIVLGIFPMGSENVTLSLRQISGVQIGVQYKIFRMLVGLLIGIFGLTTIAAGIGLIILPVGVFVFGSGIRSAIVATTSAGSTYCPIVFWGKGKAATLINELNRAIAESI